MSRERYRGPRNRVSVWNWMGTILLLSIPGVNIIALFLFLFLAKSQPKRSFALATLLLTLILCALILAAYMLFPAELKSLTTWMRDLSPDGVTNPLELITPTATPTIAPLIAP